MSRVAKPRVQQLTTPAARIPPSRTQQPPRIDPSSPLYKKTAAKYVRFMVAMPILVVTSYYLFDRLALGHEQKHLPRAKSVEEHSN